MRTKLFPFVAVSTLLLGSPSMAGLSEAQQSLAERTAQTVTEINTVGAAEALALIRETDAEVQDLLDRYETEANRPGFQFNQEVARLLFAAADSYETVLNALIDPNGVLTVQQGYFRDLAEIEQEVQVELDKVNRDRLGYERELETLLEAFHKETAPTAKLKLDISITARRVGVEAAEVKAQLWREFLDRHRELSRKTASISSALDVLTHILKESVRVYRLAGELAEFHYEALRQIDALTILAEQQEIVTVQVKTNFAHISELLKEIQEIGLHIRAASAS